MNAKLGVLAAVAVALFVAACAPSAHSLIVGTWEMEGTSQVTATFGRDGTTTFTIFGQTIRGTYKWDSVGELQWTLNGRTTFQRVKVTSTDLELTDAANVTIQYRRK